MDEFSVALYPAKVTKHDSGVHKYPIIIEDQNVRPKDGWDPERMASREGIWLYNGEINKALHSSAADFCAVLAPTYLDVMLAQLHRNMKDQRLWDDMGFAEKRRRVHNFQTTYYKGSKFTGKGLIEIWNAQIHADATYLETLTYDYHPVEKKCNHTYIEEWLNQYYGGLRKLCQPGCYVLKETQKLMIKDEVEWQIVENEVGGVGNGKGKQIAKPKNMQKGVQYLDKYKEVDQIKMRARAYRLETYGMYAAYENVEPFKKILNGIDEIISGWKKTFNELPYGKICFWMSELAREICNKRETYEENKEISERYQKELKKNFLDRSQEATNIRKDAKTDREAFAAIALVSACDAVEDKVTWEHRFACCRGTLMYAELIMGDAYFHIRKYLKWSIRERYYPRRQIEEGKQYIYRKVSLFNSDLKKGQDVIIWNAVREQGKDCHVNTGNLCQKTDIDESDLYFWHDERLYSEMMSRLINGDHKLSAIKDTDLYQSDVNVYRMDIARDTYLDETGDLFYPTYLDKDIACPMYSIKYRSKIVRITTEQPKDVWEMRIPGTYLTGFDHAPCFPLSSKMSEIDDVVGQSLKRKQKGSKYYDYVTEATQGAIPEEERCIVEAMTKDVLTFQKKFIFSKLKHLTISSYILEHSKKIYNMGELDVWGLDEQIAKYETLSQFLIALLVFILEGKLITIDEEDARLYVQAIIDGKVMEIARRLSPRLVEILSRRDKVFKLEETFWYNILLIIKFSYRNRILHQTMVYPIIYSTQMLLHVLPAKECSMWTLVSLAQFHPGLVTRTRDLDEAENILFNECVNNIMTAKITSIYEGPRTSDSKLMQFKIFCGSMCSGVSEMVYMIRAIIHPEPGLIVVAITDGLRTKECAVKCIMRNFKHMRASIKGIAIINLVGDDDLACSNVGVCNSKRVERTFMRLKHKVAIIKTKGCVLGNEELISKIMNRGV
nr:VP2 [Tibet orbivirus]